MKKFVIGVTLLASMSVFAEGDYKFLAHSAKERISGDVEQVVHQRADLICKTFYNKNNGAKFIDIGWSRYPIKLIDVLSTPASYKTYSPEYFNPNQEEIDELSSLGTPTWTTMMELEHLRSSGTTYLVGVFTDIKCND